MPVIYSSRGPRYNYELIKADLIMSLSLSGGHIGRPNLHGFRLLRPGFGSGTIESFTSYLP